MGTLTNSSTHQDWQARGRIFEQEFLPLMGAVSNFAYRLTGNAEASDDLVQETYLKVWRFIDRYTAETNAKAWIFRICRNAFINEYRTRKNRPYKVDYEDIVIYHNEDEPASPRYADFYTEGDPSQMGDEIMLAIRRLSDNYRTVVLLDLEDFSYEEIAAILSIPIGTVRSRLHRARHELSKSLRQYASDRGYGVQDQEEGPTGADQPE
ncbi:MAG: sigma-70 family RNA polymerase sigma factor [Saprospiraceae bacterium]|nr:sigma-70 family RNA polymerase sigma factor [Saprospiraceae bacterium]